MTKNDVTFNSIVRIKKDGRKGIVTGFTLAYDKIVGIAVRIPQRKPEMYLPSEVEIIRF